MIQIEKDIKKLGESTTTIEALQRIVDHYYADELDHYDQNGQDSNHIVIYLRKILDDFNL